MRCLISGSGSDIARELHTHLLVDGWEVEGKPGRSLDMPDGRWDLLILAQGLLEPIGKFFECDEMEWESCMYRNSIFPLVCLRHVWPQRNPNATVIFLGGPNMAHPSPTYSAYRAGKAILESLAGTLEAEYPDHKFRVLRPGVVRTKIHEQTLRAGERAANYERVKSIMDGTEQTVSYDEVYRKLKELL